MTNFISNFLKNSLSKESVVNNNKEVIINDEEKIWKDDFKIDSEKKMEKIEIKGKNYKKIFLWIIFQFVVWIFLFNISWSYIQSHEAEKKFFNSSISYWKWIWLNLATKIWLKDYVYNLYEKDRKKMLSEIEKLSKRIQKCIALKKNKDEILALKKIKNDVDVLWYELKDKSIVTDEVFIKKYGYYSLWLDNFRNGISAYCK